MKRRDVGDKARRISNLFKDRDEELSLFRDLKDQVGNLLQPVSEEFEANGNNGGLYRMDSSGRKGGLASGKNDYNWLKTPPATPLFPSLDMETNGAELVVQKEIPIIHPLSRFAGTSEGNIRTAKNTNPNPKPPQRLKTPTGSPSISSLNDKKNMKTAPLMHQTYTDKTKLAPKENVPNPSPKPVTRGVSPFVRPKLTGFSEQTPPNLKTTNRPASATRGRPANQTLLAPQKQETNAQIRRQSCSPSVARGRKLDSEKNATNQSGNRGQVLGSRMVERFMNARLSNVSVKTRPTDESYKASSGEERHGKIKLNTSLNESSGFGRLMSKSSLDMARKRMEFQRESTNNRKHGIVEGRKSSGISNI